MPEDLKQLPPRFTSFRSTLIRTFILFSVVILFVSSIFAVVFTFGIDQKSVASQEQTVATNAAATVNYFIDNNLRVLDSVANTDDLTEENVESRKNIAYKLLGRNPAFRNILITDIQGQEQVIATRLSTTNLDKTLALVHTDLLEGIVHGTSYISPVYIDTVTNEPLILIAVPAKNRLGDTELALIAELNLKFMWDLVGSIKVGDTGSAYVVDKDGYLIAFGDTSRVLARENLNGLEPVRAFLNTHDANGGTNPGTVFFSKGIQGNTVIATGVRLTTTGWEVVVEQPIFEAYRVLLNILISFVAVLLVTVLVALFISSYVARRITKGVVDLNAAAERISAGDLNTTIDITSNNEIGHVAHSFNIMASKLKDIYVNLDNKVKEKTTELSDKVKELEISKGSITHLLEDIQSEKEQSDRTVIARTKELSDEKSRLLASINSLSLGYIMADVVGNIILSNDAVLKILEIPQSPSAILDVAKCFDQFDLVSKCQECLLSNKSVSIKDISYKSKFLRIFCAPIANNNQTIGHVLLIDDVTEAKVLERSKDEFFAVASHELRTPLTAIRGNAEMIMGIYADKVTDKDVREMISDIDEASVRLIGIVNDFLEVSRLEQGNILFEKSQFKLVDVIKKVVDAVKLTIAGKNVTLAFVEPYRPVPEVVGDKGRTEQVLFNLIGNSVKFTKEGSVTVTVMQIENAVKVLVTDTGTGISEQNRSLLFRKFQPAGDKSLARDVSKSTGLGLYISKLLTEKMGGTIGLEKTELGVGSTFFFTLPAGS